MFEFSVFLCSCSEQPLWASVAQRSWEGVLHKSVIDAAAFNNGLIPKQESSVPGGQQDQPYHGPGEPPQDIDTTEGENLKKDKLSVDVIDWWAIYSQGNFVHSLISDLYYIESQNSIRKVKTRWMSVVTEFLQDLVFSWSSVFLRLSQFGRLTG